MKSFLQTAAILVALGLLCFFLPPDGFRLPRRWLSGIAIFSAVAGGSALWELARNEAQLRTQDRRLTQARDEIQRLRERIDALDADMQSMRAQAADPATCRPFPARV